MVVSGHTWSYINNDFPIEKEVGIFKAFCVMESELNKLHKLLDLLKVYKAQRATLPLGGVAR
jgi:hypothetical protein